MLKIAPVTGQPGEKMLTYNPIVVGSGQVYSVQFRTNLTVGAACAYRYERANDQWNASNRSRHASDANEEVLPRRHKFTMNHI